MSRRTASTFSEQPRLKRLSSWVLVAALVHGEVMLFVGVFAYFKAPRNSELTALAGKGAAGEPIEVTTIDDETARQILAEMDAADEKAKEETVKKEVEASEAPGQTVQIAKPQEEKRPENARFAAEYDSSVEKETRKYGKFDPQARQGAARGDADENRPATPQPQRSAGAATPPGALALKTPGAPGRGQSAPTRAAETPPAITGPGSDAVTGPPDPEGTQVAGGRLLLKPPVLGGGVDGEQGARPAAPGEGIAALTPSQQQIARALGSGTEDYLRDIDEGDETALNAKKWKFASFFNRVKAQVREHWRPDEAYQRRDPTGSIYGSKDRYTLLRVQLKPDGTLANVTLENPSGVEFLDDEAVEAFKQAQPFPNPPRQLVEGESGLINFRFGFYFELSGAPKMKVFRYNSM